MSVQREPLPYRVAAAGVFGYEIVALFTNLPTISALNDRHPWLGKAILVGLAVHFRSP